MAYVYPFEKLEVWKLSIDFTKEIYGLTKKFPKEEKYNLVSQINRATVSIASNIAEGSARTSRKDQAHFYQIAFSSAMEVVCQLIICRQLEYISEEEYNQIRMEIEKITNKLNSLRAYQINALSNQRINKSSHYQDVSL